MGSSRDIGDIYLNPPPANFTLLINYHILLFIISPVKHITTCYIDLDKRTNAKYMKMRKRKLTLQ